MNLLTRINKLEHSAGIKGINIADELTRLKKLSKEGKAAPKHTVEELQKLADASPNKGLVKIYRAGIRARKLASAA
jgi:predicted PilT family ATPase